MKNMSEKRILKFKEINKFLAKMHIDTSYGREIKTKRTMLPKHHAPVSWGNLLGDWVEEYIGKPGTIIVCAITYRTIQFDLFFFLLQKF